MNILGSKIYIFGGQVEGYFFNDLVAFDLNALQQATNRWEILIQNTIDGGPPHGQIPPARTNHTMITWGDKLYLFGGTDGVQWFNDVWAYSPHTNSWTQLECIGYIPSPREGHAAALVGDVMYIFGGRNEDGNDLGDLAAFRITSRRWYTFQNMGPSPSPRSGHSMTTLGKQIVVLAGEPSSAPRDPVELAYAYFLDTSKIRYPPDSSTPTPTNERVPGHRRPSGERNGMPIAAAGRLPQERQGSGDSRIRADSSGTQSRLPQPGRLGQLPAPSGPPPQAPPQQARGMSSSAPPSRQPSRPDRAMSPQRELEQTHSFERSGMGSPQPPFASSVARGTPTPQDSSLPTSPSFAPGQSSYYDAEQDPRPYQPETYQPSQDRTGGSMSRNASLSQKGNRTDMQRFEETPRQSIDEVVEPEPTPKVRDLQREDDGPQDSGIGSSPALTHQYDEMAKELDQLRSRNAWYASELALARKSGYTTRSTDSPVMNESAADFFAEDDKPLIEALLKMRAELASVQEKIDEQSKSAAERIAEIEKQRDQAVNEAVYAKTRLAGKGVEGSEGKGTPDQDRSNDISKRLAASLASQTELSKRIEGLTQEAEAERKARELAEETSQAAERRVTDLESSRQQYSSELESLRSELYEAQRVARDMSANHADIKSQHDLLSVDKRELDGKLERALADSSNHTSILSTLREAVTASTEKAQMLEEKLDEERGQRDDLEQKLRQLKAEHEDRTHELDTTSRKLRDAEEMAERHATEARTHREAVLAGFGRVSDRNSTSEAVDERVTILQQQVESANAMVRQNQESADAAADKLRRAEERIAGLEAFQEQASREGLSIRKQLQAATKESQALTSQKAELEQKLQSQMLETNALSVQHASLRDVLGERGINASDVRKSRAIDSPSSMSRFSTPDLHRVRELEQQLEASLKSHDDMKTQFEEVSERDDRMKREYEEKLTALDNDHQAAVKYLRGTEKMLSKMKQELQRVKNENGDLRKKLEKARDDAGSARASAEPTEWEAERERLKREVADVQANLKSSVEDLETKLSSMQQQLHSAESELQQARTTHESSQRELQTLQSSHTQSRTDLEKLQNDNSILEERARDAENKVQLLLDQVESSVDNYRRASRMGSGVPTLNGGFHHQRSPSDETTTDQDAGSTTAGTKGGMSTHTRNISDGAASNFSATSDGAGSNADGRNSLALDALAGELETLRSHWETTNKNYRLSDKFEFERSGAGASGGEVGGLASWRKGLDVDLSDDERDSRPGTSEGDTSTVTGSPAMATAPGQQQGKML